MGFIEAWKATSVVEKGYVNNPKDRGGPTNHGITEREARARGFVGDMKDLPIELATQWAEEDYWSVWLEAISTVSQKITNEIFDSGFLHGPGTAARWLQESLNELNRGGHDYGDIPVDGRIGKVTIESLKSYMKKRATQDGEKVMLTALNIKQGAYCQAIVQRDPTQEEFLYGWLRNRVGI